MKVKILRYNPQDHTSTPHIVDYEVEEAFGMTLFFVLNEIRAKYDGSLQFDFFCGTGYCGSCSMLINGRPGLACKTLTKHLDSSITLAPLPGFQLIGDLSIDLNHCIEGMNQWLDTWIRKHAEETLDIEALREQMKPKLGREIYASENGTFSLNRMETRMEPEQAEEIFKLHSCIDCGCCIAASGIKELQENVINQTPLEKIGTGLNFYTDDKENKKYYFVKNNNKVFGIASPREDNDICPKKLPQQLQIIHMIRKMSIL